MSITDIQWAVSIISFLVFLVCLATTKTARRWYLINKHSCFSPDKALKMANIAMRRANYVEHSNDHVVRKLYLEYLQEADELYELEILLRNQRK